MFDADESALASFNIEAAAASVLGKKSSPGLTAEQRQRIEAKKTQALARKKAKQEAFRSPFASQPYATPSPGGWQNVVKKRSLFSPVSSSKAFSSSQTTSQPSSPALLESLSRFLHSRFQDLTRELQPIASLSFCDTDSTASGSSDQSRRK